MLTDIEYITRIYIGIKFSSFLWFADEYIVNLKRVILRATTDYCGYTLVKIWEILIVPKHDFVICGYTTHRYVCTHFYIYVKEIKAFLVKSVRLRISLHV